MYAKIIYFNLHGQESYDLSEYNVEECTQEDYISNNEHSITSRMWKKKIFMPSKAKLEIVLKIYKLRALRFMFSS